MRPLKLLEVIGVLALVVGAFLFGMSFGNLRAERSLYLMFMKLGNAATEGDPAAIKACDGLKEKQAAINTTNLSQHIYQVLSYYDRREDRSRQ